MLKHLKLVHFICVNYISINKSISEENDQDAISFTEGELTTYQALFWVPCWCLPFPPHSSPTQHACVYLVCSSFYADVGVGHRAHTYTHSFPNLRASAGQARGCTRVHRDIHRNRCLPAPVCYMQKHHWTIVRC